uniref:Plakophilin-3 n=1 Tax=Dicentrarchus labrax TaxID=13489 RepID=A0A8C4FG29_DICLA
MSTVASENVFLTALQPNTSVTTYGLPSDIQIGNGSSVSDEVARARRVQQQVQMRLAEKSALPRQNGSTSHYPHVPRVSQRGGFSCQSAGPDMAQYHKISVGGGGVGGGGGGGGGYYREDIRMGGYQGGTMRQQSRMEPDNLSMHAMRQHIVPINSWGVENSDAGSMVSDRDATYGRQYAQSAINGYTSQVRQGGGTMTVSAPMRQSLSGTLTRSGGMTGGEAEVVQQHSFKGPAHRTISRITHRNRMSMGSMSGTMQQMSSGGSTYGGGDRVDRGFITSGVSSGSQGNLFMQRPGFKFFGLNLLICSFGRITSLDMPTAVQYLREADPEMQVLGAAYIQHECYNDSDAKNEVRSYRGITELVRLFNSENQEVQRYATGATRNLIYENMENKVALIEEGGIPQLVEALKENDDELRKNITGILWNLSSKDNLKQKLARETLNDLTERILIPLSISGDSDSIQQSASEAEIFYNTTGCLRNLSSVNEKTRQQMRETHGLVDSLVKYIKASLEESKADDKGVENAMCVLRNLSYQIYTEMPPSSMMRLEGPTRAQGSGTGDAIGCFTPQSRKAKNSKNQDLSTFTEVARVPKGFEWLWHPQIVGVYKNALQQCEINSTTREAAAGALQNITAGDKRWASVLSQVSLEQERILPVLLELLRTNKDVELRSLTGLLRNLSRHARDKNDMATKVVNILVTKLPADGHQKDPTSDVVVNICGILNNLVTSSSLAARDINFFDGIPKLIGIKTSHDNSSGKLKAAKAAATVLSNMFHYKKLHSSYKTVRDCRND